MRRDTWVATPLELLLKSPESTASEPHASAVDMAALAFAVGAMFSFLQGFIEKRFRLISLLAQGPG
jgi:hypothetical protein